MVEELRLGMLLGRRPEREWRRIVAAQATL